jgi:hypothetical protein
VNQIRKSNKMQTGRREPDKKSEGSIYHAHPILSLVLLASGNYPAKLRLKPTRELDADFADER